MMIGLSGGLVLKPLLGGFKYCALSIILVHTKCTFEDRLL
jgi:hypothetical protein